jgi:hypothetical protein
MVKTLGYKDYFLSLSKEALSTLMDTNIQKINSVIGWEGIFKTPEQEACIAQYGFISTVQSKKSMISTTLMEINQIIQSKILSLSLTPIICVCTCLPKRERNYQENLSEKQLKRQKNGIDQKKVWNGMRNTEKHVLKKESCWKSLAIIVKKYINQFKSFLNTAHQHANQISGENQERTTKQENAKYVLKNFQSIDFLQKEHAHLVVEQCSAIEREVYDLTIKDDHCYFANGFLVSNSNYGDALQYTCQAVGHLETVGSLSGAKEKHKLVVENRTKRVI